MAIDVSTHQLAELTSNATNHKISVDDILNVWHSIGSLIKNQLENGKGVKMAGFGTFSLHEIKLQPIFTMSTEFSSQFKLKQSFPGVAANIPTLMTNFQYISKVCKLDRETVEKIYNKFMKALGSAISEGRMVLLTIHKVAEIRISNGMLSCDFMAVFLSSFQPSTTTQPSLNKSMSKSSINIQRPDSRQSSYSNSSSTRLQSTGQRSATPTNNIRRPSNDFASLLSQSNVEKVKRQPSQQGNARELAARALSSNTNNASSQLVIDRVREKIIQRGGSNGIRTIGNLLKIMDDNGDKRLSKDELKYGLRDYGIDLNPAELEQVFLYFDSDGNGYINFDEFLVGLRGDMNERRKGLVQLAFDILDTDRSGSICVDEIISKYDFSHDPDVKEGKKTIQKAAKDFMLQWEKHDSNGDITFKEFEEYYRDVSASIDDDDYFELMMRNAWRIPGGKGMAANTANRRVLVTKADGSQSVETINNELGLRANDMGGIRSRLMQQGTLGQGGNDKIDLYGSSDDTNNRNMNFRKLNSSNISNAGLRPSSNNNVSSQQSMSRLNGTFSQPSNVREAWGNGSSNTNKSVSSQFDPVESLRLALYDPPVTLEQLCKKMQVSLASQNPRIAKGAFKTVIGSIDPSLDSNQINIIYNTIDPKKTGFIDVVSFHEFLGSKYGKDKKSKSVGSNIIDRAKAKILERCGGEGGIKGLTRVLSIMDTSGDKQLSRDELKYGLQNYGIELNIKELEELFLSFDRDRSGSIDINEFLIGLRGDLNDRRKSIIRLAFNILDTDGSGSINIDEISKVYDTSKHPEVIAGKKTKNQVLKEFMSQWDKHDSDGDITYEEFEEYYKAISVSIDGDDYFELMMRNAWRIPGGKGMAANTANRRVLVTKADGSQSVETINNELGLRANDMGGIRSRLMQQGTLGQGGNDKIELYGSSDDANTRNRPSSKSNALQSSNRPNGSKSVQEPPQRTKFERAAAAVKLAAAFRGRLARKQFQEEKRKQDRIQQQQDEEFADSNRQRPRQILRPKGKSYIGF